ncbi:MAG: hypothetical protein GY737_30035 [Desulfobacteraceae bacterium]|nr:hypothetical protein [Desulfobacteraceae bacterium]
MKRDTGDLMQYVRSAVTEQPGVSGGTAIAPPVVSSLLNRMERMEEHVFPANQPPLVVVEEMPLAMDAQQQQQQQLLLAQQQVWAAPQQPPAAEEQPPQ